MSLSHEVVKSRIIAKHNEVVRKARELFYGFRHAPEVQVYFSKLAEPLARLTVICAAATMSTFSLRIWSVS